MLEYFAYKKFKKHKAGKEEQGQVHKGKEAEGPPTPVLTEDDERFLRRLTAAPADQDGDDDEQRPALPPRVRTPDLTWDSDSESFRKLKQGEGSKSEGKNTSKKASRLSLFLRRDKKSPEGADLDPTRLSVSAPEIDHERDDLTRVLDDLNLSAMNNKAFSLSDESTELMKNFTNVLKDLVNGVPTAANDLKALLDDKDGTLAKTYEKLPKSMKKLVTQLPDKLTSTMGPELFAAAAAGAKGLEQEERSSGGGGLKGAAKRLLVPKNLTDMVTKPGAVVGMLKAILNALKLRWPAFIGTNVVWSVAIFRKFTHFPGRS